MNTKSKTEITLHCIVRDMLEDNILPHDFMQALRNRITEKIESAYELWEIDFSSETMGDAYTIMLLVDDIAEVFYNEEIYRYMYMSEYMFQNYRPTQSLGLFEQLN